MFVVLTIIVVAVDNKYGSAVLIVPDTGCTTRNRLEYVHDLLTRAGGDVSGELTARNGRPSPMSNPLPLHHDKGIWSGLTGEA